MAGVEGRRGQRRNGIREDGDGEHTVTLPSGVDLTLAELQEMAARQQQQIAAQQQLLVAKEQRLKFLKQQELRHQQIASENERLRRLREKVEAQELKLKKLRALRGQVDQHKQGSGNLTAELETIKTLFNEKEKELSVAVVKVEELTRQLEELRKGRNHGMKDQTSQNSPALLELEKLRKELVIRNKQNEAQNAKLAQHRELLLQKKEEMASMDHRIAELQARLRKKRSQQQESQQNLANQTTKPANNNNKSTPNIAAVEPYIKHLPPAPSADIIQNEKGYNLSKNDPKYKTLPYNMKLLSLDGKAEGDEGKGLEMGNGDLKVDTGYNAKSSHDAPSPSGKQKVSDLLPKETIHNTSHFTPSLGHTTAYQAMEDTLKQSAQDSSKLVPTAKNIFGVDYKAPSNLSNFAPRPFGTTFSTALLSGRPTIISTLPQASPGLSTTTQSPGGFPKTSTPVNNTASRHNNNNNDMKEIFITGAPVTMPSKTSPTYSHAKPGQPPYSGSGPPVPSSMVTSVVSTTTSSRVYGDQNSGPVYQIASSRPQPPMQPQRTQDPPSPSSTASSGSASNALHKPPVQANGQKSLSSSDQKSSSQQQTGYTSSSKPYSSTISAPTSGPPIYNGQKLPSARSNGADSQMGYHARNGPTDVADNAKPFEQSQSASLHANQENKDSSNSVSSALSVLMSSTTTTSASNKPTYRYAPKSVIANTYMKKLGSTTLDQYRQNMNKLYKDFSNPNQQSSPPEEKPDPQVSQAVPPPSSPTATVRPINQPSQADSDSKSNEKDQEPEGVKPPIFLRGPPPYPGAPPYNIDPVHYRPNAPKTLRRRLSSGESDEFHKISQKIVQRRRSEEEEEEDNVFEIARHRHIPYQPDVIRMDSITDSYNNNHGSSSQQGQDSHKEESVTVEGDKTSSKDSHMPMVLRRIKGIVKTKDSVKSTRRVSFDPLALLLDASLEGELELVQRTAKEVSDPSAPNDEGITALHNAICAGHYDIVKFLVEFGCNVNAPDSDGWTPLHCAASCNNLPMVKFLVEHGACIFATTISDHETAAEKCEEDEDGYDGCSEYLYSVQEKLGIMNKGMVYAVFDYNAQHNDELSFQDTDAITILRKGDENEKEWWWARMKDREGYVPRNLLGLYPRVVPQFQKEAPSILRSPQK